MINNLLNINIEKCTIGFTVYTEIKYRAKLAQKLRQGKWNQKVLRFLHCPGKNRTYFPLKLDKSRIYVVISSVTTESMYSKRTDNQTNRGRK